MSTFSNRVYLRHTLQQNQPTDIVLNPKSFLVRPHRGRTNARVKGHCPLRGPGARSPWSAWVKPSEKRLREPQQSDKHPLRNF
jgi:hypothetical protein